MLLKIRGVEVDFPFQPYECQVVYMERLITALQQKQNALLESPTGTGKTLCLLCATLAWRDNQLLQSQSRTGENRGGAVPTIVYAARTHSQLTQVVKELRNTRYAPHISVIGARTHMCVHPTVSKEKGSRQNVMCRNLVKESKCTFKNNLQTELNRLSISAERAQVSSKGMGTAASAMGSSAAATPAASSSSHPFGRRHISLTYERRNKVRDMEEVVEAGKRAQVCPYYKARDAVAQNAAEVFFMPYNYLVDPVVRATLPIPWDGAVLIFDEAHNLESVCSEASSFDLTAAQVAGAIGEMDRCIDHCETQGQGGGGQYSGDDYLRLKALLMEIEQMVDAEELPRSGAGLTKPGDYLFTLLERQSITAASKQSLLEILDEAVTILSTPDMEDMVSTSNKICFTEALRNAFQMLFQQDGTAEKARKYYRMHIHEDAPKFKRKKRSMAFGSSGGGRSKRKGRTLSFWCMTPGIAMTNMMKLGVRNLILTSGTLSPLDSFASEMQVSFPVRLENPHVITSQQVWVGAVTTGPGGKRLDSSYNYRDTMEYKNELGNLLVNFARVIPGGLLVFFPSYTTMEICTQYWKGKTSTVWSRIQSKKPIFMESRRSEEFKEVSNAFDEAVKKEKGAVFMAVCRGKVSEGIDFSDVRGRAVVITGLPYPPNKDPKIIVKRRYLDEACRREGGKLDGSTWYSQQASRAVNQAIGRVIRHVHDYGAIILCDHRFSHSRQQKTLSLWIRHQIQNHHQFGIANKGLIHFFRNRAASGIASRASTAAAGKRAPPGLSTFALAGIASVQTKPSRNESLPFPAFSSSARATPSNDPFDRVRLDDKPGKGKSTTASNEVQASTSALKRKTPFAPARGGGLSLVAGLAGTSSATQVHSSRIGSSVPMTSLLDSGFVGCMDASSPPSLSGFADLQARAKRQKSSSTRTSTGEKQKEKGKAIGSSKIKSKSNAAASKVQEVKAATKAALGRRGLKTMQKCLKKVVGAHRNKEANVGAHLEELHTLLKAHPKLIKLMSTILPTSLRERFTALS